jgi:hypothetical protein
MACRYAPEQLRSHYDEAGNAPISRAGHLKFRDALISILNKLRTKTVTGSISVTGLTAGNSITKVVDHSEDATFCFSEYPIFTSLDGVDVLVYAMKTVSGTAELTDGDGFVVLVTNTSYAGSSFTLDWSRTGMVG